MDIRIWPRGLTYVAPRYVTLSVSSGKSRLADENLFAESERISPTTHATASLFRSGFVRQRLSHRADQSQFTQNEDCTRRKVTPTYRLQSCSSGEMKVSKATHHEVPNEIEFQTPLGNTKKGSRSRPTSTRDSVEAFRSSHSVGSSADRSIRDNSDPYLHEEENDDALNFRDSLEDDSYRHDKERQEIATSFLQTPPTKYERRSAVDDISLTEDTAPSSASCIQLATIGPLPKSRANAVVSAKTSMSLPFQNFRALDCGGLPTSLEPNDELASNMRVGVGVAGRAAKSTPGGKEVMHGVNAGIAYAEETAQSAQKLISDTQKLARDMDIHKFAAPSASYSFGDESGESEYGSGSNSYGTKNFRYTECDETSYYSKDDLGMETMQSSFVTENPSGIYTASVAPSTVISSVAPSIVTSSRAPLGSYRNKAPKTPKAKNRVALPRSIARRTDQDAIPAKAQEQNPVVVSTGRNVQDALASDGNHHDEEDDDSEYTEVTYLSDMNQEKVEGTNGHANDNNSSDCTEVVSTLNGNTTGTENVKNREQGLLVTAPNDDVSKHDDTRIGDKVIPEPSERPKIITTQAKSPEKILADNTVDIEPLKVDWIDPPPEQASLIAAVLSTSIGRRSNACGTIKMIASNKKKAAALARTRILLDALILAINDGSQTAEEKELFLEAQARATIAISHLSEVKENRVLLAQHPGLVKTLIDVIKIDKGEARVAACRSLVMMSKIQQNKTTIVKTDGLVALFADIMSGRYDKHTECGGKAGISSSFSSAHSNSNGGSRSQCQSRGNSSRSGSMTIRQCKSARYQEFLSLACVNCCAAFSHLAKDCASSAILCKDEAFISALLSLCSNTRTPMFKRCLELLAHLTRFSGNCEVLASNGAIVQVLVTSGKAKCLEERLCALRSFQNISAVCAESRMILAADSVLGPLVSAAFEGTKDEQEASLGTILNLALETGTLVSLTNTKNFTAVLIHIINSADASSTSCERARQILRLIANWMNTLADTGTGNAADNTIFKPTGWMLYT